MDRAEAALDLGAAVIKAVARLWAGPLADITSPIIDLVKRQIEDKFEQRRALRFFDRCVDTVARRLVSVFDSSRLPENELNATVLAVKDTFLNAAFDDIDVIRKDLSPALVEDAMSPSISIVLKHAALSSRAESLYRLILRESCAYVVEVVSTLPRFTERAIPEILRRETAILETLDRVLDLLPERRALDDFEVDYRRQVINKLDRMELFGLRLSNEANRRYPLSIAYISLSALARPTEFTGAESNEVRIMGSATAGETKVEEVLGQASRVMLFGEAGSGKTTLLRWLAVRAARQDFPALMAPWNNYLPFVILMREYVDAPLPTPEKFVESIAKNIASEMSPSWVQNLLRNGRALILIDGIDELHAKSRHEAHKWIVNLVRDFPNSRVVVTSRPSAVPYDWLSSRELTRDSREFIAADLQPLSRSSLRLFIQHWHVAVGREIQGRDEQAELTGDQEALISVLDSDRHLRSLCINPLLCAMVCALNRERRRQLPQNRMGMYKASLEMLLDLRDRERGVHSDLDLSYDQKMTLLQDLALYLVRNSWVSTSTERAVNRISRTMWTLQNVRTTPQESLRQLLERSGVLREPTANSIDFIHRSFQEYLAGKAAVENDDIGYLVENAANDQLREVIIMAVGHAQPRQREELLGNLLKQSGISKRADVSQIRLSSMDHASQARVLLAIASLQNCHQLDPELRATIEGLAEQMLPPRSIELASVLAAAGDVVFEGLVSRPPQTTEEAIASIRLATLVGGDTGIQVIAEIAEHHLEIEAEVARAWSFFDPAEYARAVLPRMRAGNNLTLKDPSLLRYLTLYKALRSVSVQGDQWLERLTVLPERPSALVNACVTARHLRNLSGIGSFAGIKVLELDLGDADPDLFPLAELKGLEKIRISTTHTNVLNLRPLAMLEGLQVVQLWQPRSYHFQLGPLADRDLTVFVPPGREVKGLRGKLSPKCKIIRIQPFPTLQT